MEYDMFFYLGLVYVVVVIGLILGMEIIAYKNRGHDPNDPIEILIRWIKSKRDK